jgi:UDP-glucose 4-epimerase
LENLQIVAGGSGFVGTNLVNFLLNKGLPVLSIDRFATNISGNSDYFELICDLSIEKDMVLKFIKDLKPRSDITIWHLAANSDIARGMENPKIELSDTFMTTINLCNIAKSISCKNFIFASTSAVYGDHSNNKLIEDKTELNPISYYGALKLASESYLKAFSHESNTKVSLYRFPNIIGKNMTHGLLYDLPRKIDHVQQKVAILGNGNQKKPYLNVEDLIKLIYQINQLSNDRVNVFNLGPNDNGIKIKEIIELYLTKNYPRIKPVFGDSENGWVGDVPIVNLSIEKMRKLIPNYNLTSLDAVNKTLSLK